MQFFCCHFHKIVSNMCLPSITTKPCYISSPPLLRIWQIKAFTDSAPRGKKSHLDIFSKSRQGPWIYRGEISSTRFQFQCTGWSSNPLPVDGLVLPANLAPPPTYPSPKKGIENSMTELSYWNIICYLRNHHILLITFST